MNKDLRILFVGRIGEMAAVVRFFNGNQITYTTEEMAAEIAEVGAIDVAIILTSSVENLQNLIDQLKNFCWVILLCPAFIDPEWFKDFGAHDVFAFGEGLADGLKESLARREQQFRSPFFT